MLSNAPVPGTARAATSKTKRVHAMLDFVTSLEARLSANSAGPLVDDDILDSVLKNIRNLHAACQIPSHPFSNNETLDKLGTAIWNHSTRLFRKTASATVTANQTKLGVYARAFAFHLLDASQQPGSAHVGSKVRLMRLALKAGRCSIEASELEVAGLVLQKGTDYVTHFGQQKNSFVSADAKDVRGLEAEYYVLRTALAWKENRLDVAEHLYSKGHLIDDSLGPYSAEKLADVLYELGNDMNLKKDFQMAVKWLQRAQDVINSHDLEQLSREALELRTAIMQAHITALLNLGTVEGFTKADSMIQFLQVQMGATMVVLLLKLELLMKAPAEVFDSTEYANLLGQMVTCLCQKNFDHVLDSDGRAASDPDFRLLTHHIGKLHDKNPALACTVLDEFILVLSNGDHDEWMERLVTKRIWMATHRAELTDAVEAADVALSPIQTPLSADATVAVQTLIWKTLELVYNKQKFDVAEQWCKLALHRVFENTGPLNRAKIERKQLLCTIAQNNIDDARSVYHGMAEETRRDPRTLYLMYKIAIRSDDREEATRCIEGISDTPEPIEYLYACCLEAQDAPHRDFAIEALSNLLNRSQNNSPGPVQLPALLRCTIRLIAKNLEGHANGTTMSEVSDKLCRLFSTVVTNIQHDIKDAQGNKLFDINELDWFARNAYNLGIKHLDAWDVAHTIDILTSCNSIMSHFPADISSDIAADVALKTLFNNFIIASALVARARAQDKIEDQLQDYLLMRKHIAAFDVSLPAQLPALVEACRADMLSKLACLLAFDFEGALTLKSYDDLLSIILKCGECGSALPLQAMADCVLRHPAVPTQTVYSALRAIINALSALEEGLDHVRLSRYMRCLLQVTLPFDEALALNLTGEYLEIMTEAVRRGLPPPEEETEWLAVTAFNHAVDCYWAKRDDDCRSWAFRAFEMARLLPDGGTGLESVLHGKFMEMRFDVA